jgi:hypothetical protein
MAGEIPLICVVYTVNENASSARPFAAGRHITCPVFNPQHQNVWRNISSLRFDGGQSSIFSTADRSCVASCTAGGSTGPLSLPSLLSPMFAKLPDVFLSDLATRTRGAVRLAVDLHKASRTRGGAAQLASLEMCSQGSGWMFANESLPTCRSLHLLQFVGNRPKIRACLCPSLLSIHASPTRSRRNAGAGAEMVSGHRIGGHSDRATCSCSGLQSQYPIFANLYAAIP